MDQSMLELALDNNDFSSLQTAVQSCTDINEQNAEGNTALHVAISEGCDYDTLKLLLSNGASVAIKNNEGFSPLQLIDSQSHVTVLNLFRLEHYIDYSGGVGNTIMHLLMMTDSAEIPLWNTILQEFATLHIDFNAQNVIGHTPLHIAASRIMGIEDIQFILNNFEGVNIFLADKKGNTFLHIFICNMLNEEYHISFLTRLLEGEFKYCTSKDISMLLSQKNNNGYTPLHSYISTCDETSIDILKLFIKQGSKIDSDNVHGENLLHTLVRRFPDEKDIIEFVVANGGNVNARNGFGETPIFFTDNIEVVHVLLEANADLSIKNKVGKSPLMSVLLRCPMKYELIEMLIKKGANLNEVDNYGNSVLHYAAWNGVDEDIINLIKENGLNIVPDGIGYLPCQVAQQMGHISIIKSICMNEKGSYAHSHDLEGSSFSKESIYFKELIHTKPKGTLNDCLHGRARSFNDKNIYDVLRMPGIGSVDFVKESKIVKDTVIKVIQNICKEISKHDELLANTVIQSGSVGEDTKVGLPDEFDFVCLLDIFSDICEIDEESTANDPGYVYVKLKQEYRVVDQYRHLFNNHCYLDTEGLRQRFVEALTDVIQNPSVCCYSNIVMELNHFKESQLAPNCQLTLRWTSCEYKDIEIDIDLVPACLITGWWPSRAKLDALASKSEEVRKEGAILLLQTTFDEEFEQVTKLRVSALSAEKTHMKCLPQYARDAYMVAKILINDKVCPRIKLSTERNESLLRTYISSYMLKNCLFHVIEEHKALQAVSYKANTNVDASKALHDCVCKLFRKFQKCINDEKLESFIFPWQDVFTFQDKDHAIFPEQNHINCTCRSIYTKLILQLLGQEESYTDIDVDILLSS